MAYTVPTASELKTRYPEFTTVDDVIVTAMIDEGKGQVDQSWPDQAVYTQGLMLLACHAMASEGRGSSSGAQIAALGPGVSRVKSGDLEVTMSAGASSNGAASSDDLDRTMYGQKFKLLRGRLFLPIGIY